MEAMPPGAVRQPAGRRRCLTWRSGSAATSSRCCCWRPTRPTCDRWSSAIPAASTAPRRRSSRGCGRASASPRSPGDGDDPEAIFRVHHVQREAVWRAAALCRMAGAGRQAAPPRPPPRPARGHPAGAQRRRGRHAALLPGRPPTRWATAWSSSTCTTGVGRSVAGDPRRRRPEALVGDVRGWGVWNPILDQRFEQRGAYVIPPLQRGPRTPTSRITGGRIWPRGTPRTAAPLRHPQPSAGGSSWSSRPGAPGRRHRTRWWRSPPTRCWPSRALRRAAPHAATGRRSSSCRPSRSSQPTETFD